MTREEAIEYFKYHRKIFCEDHLKICPKDSIAYQATLKEKEFYDIAIKALEQESTWIPVSERLPDEDGEYLLYGKIDEDEDNYIFVGEYDACGEEFGVWQEQFDRTSLGCLGSEFFEYSNVIAWMPLPQPYKAESEG